MIIYITLEIIKIYIETETGGFFYLRKRIAGVAVLLTRCPRRLQPSSRRPTAFRRL